MTVITGSLERNLDDEVKQLLSDEPAFAKLRESLDDPRRMEEVQAFLRDILFNHDCYYRPAIQDYFGRNLEYWIEETRKLVQKYIDTPWMHNAWITSYLLKEVIDSQLARLEWAAYMDVYPWYALRRRLVEPYRTFVPPILGILGFFLFAGLIVYLLYKELPVAAVLVLAYMGYHYVIKFRKRRYRLKTRRKIVEWIELLSIPRNEIGIGGYDSEAIARRLQSYEQKGLYVYSVVFPLLNLRAAGK